MKNLVIVLLVVTTAVFGGWFFSQQKKTGQAESKVLELEAQLKKRQDADAKVVAKKEKQVKELRGRLNDTTAVAVEKSSQVSQLEQALTAAKTNSPVNGLAAMFKSPEMREMIKTQQKAVIGPMIDKTYSPVFQQLNLNAEQSTHLKGLLEKKMLGGSEAGLAMLDSDLDPAKRTELMKKIKDDGEAVNAEIKQFLGEQNYQQFEAYEKVLPERMQVGAFKDQMAGAGNPLAPTQEAQLIQALSEERQNFKFTTDYNDQSMKFGGNVAEFFTEERLNQFATEKAQLDQRSLVRAQQILTPEQYEAFDKSQKTQRDMQMMGMKMAAKMFAPSGGGK